MSDLKINGLGNYSGGVFDTVDVDGIATISSDVSAVSFSNDGVLTLQGSLDCQKMDCDGIMTAKGHVGAESAEIDGVITVGGFFHCNTLSCDGTATIDGELKAQHVELDGIMTIKEGLQTTAFSCDGTLTVRKDLVADQSAEIDGCVSIHGGVQAGTFSCDGTATIDGDMRCETFESSGLVTLKGSKFEGTHIRGDGCLSAAEAQISADVVDFDGKISADEIVGDSVTIRSRNKILAFFSFKKFSSEARLIEATNVSLCGVKANEVNGQHIRLTDGCVIDQVDCSGTLHIDPSCQIGQITGEYQMV